MSISQILLGLLPLCAFVIIDSFMGLKAGLFAAIALAFAEAIYSILEFGTLDELSIASLFFVLIFGFISFKTNNSIYLKLQPVFLGLCFGVVILIFQVLDKPILLAMIEKYGSMVPEQMREVVKSPQMQRMLATSSLFLGFGFVVHAGLVAYAALRMSNWWWLIIRGVGLYLMMGLCVLCARIF